MSRILVLSDVHANAAALDAVLAAERDPDAVVFLGDAVDNGPHPDAVCQRLREREYKLIGVRGNHDRAVLDADPSDRHDDPHARWRAWTNDRLSAESRAFLSALDRTTTIDLDDRPRTLRLHHGDFPLPADHVGQWSTRVTPEDDRTLFETVATRYDEDVLLHGHSHYPFVADVGGTTFVNPGSVGLQRPGWRVDRARYAILEDGAVDLRSISYDIEAVVSDLRDLESPHLGIWDRPDTSASAP